MEIKIATGEKKRADWIGLEKFALQQAANSHC